MKHATLQVTPFLFHEQLKTNTYLISTCGGGFKYAIAEILVDDNASLCVWTDFKFHQLNLITNSKIKIK